ncbi:MAG: zf-TFIIB domain-containing protein, partial [Myxococcota bacterium]|nr:zf-TFIIB domain-containing protein [Myxococcota bacterium]
MNFKCPVCSVALQRSRSEGVSQWLCPQCMGRAVAVGVLRRLTNRRVVTAFWGLARDGGQPTDRPCACCDHPMRRVTKVLPPGEGVASEASLELDACLRCQFIWFDPGEFS